MIRTHHPETSRTMFETFLGRVSWLLKRFATHEKLKNKIAQKQTVINIPEQYAKLSEGNTISGLQLFHCEKKGETTAKAKYTFRIWIYLTPDGSVGYVESIEIAGQESCSWQHNIWNLDEDSKFQTLREEEHSVPGMTHAILKGLLLERLGLSFESEANTAIKKFLKS